MKRKPASCEGCPLFGDGYGWVPDTLDSSAPLLVIEMYPSTYEALQQVREVCWAYT
jgi:hypothetical protein